VRDVEFSGQWITGQLMIPADPPGPKPVIISPTGNHDVLLGLGIVLVTYRVNWNLLSGFAKKPDPEPAAPEPQKQYGAWLLASPRRETVGQGYLTLIAYDANAAIPKVIDYLEQLPEVDPARIGIAGNSTSGFTALQAVAADRRLRVAAVNVACGDYHTFLHHSSLAMNGEDLVLDPAYDAWLKEQEPIRHPERLVHAALFMVNGTDDKAIPLACATRTTRVFRAAYRRAGASERFRSVVLAGVGHSAGGTAADQVLAWWYRWLLPASQAANTEGAERLRDEHALGAQDLTLGDGHRAP
jgi:dienelactone hydrolase